MTAFTRRWAVTVLAGLLVFSMATPWALADPVRDQGQIFGTGSIVDVGSDDWSQSITTGLAGTLASIELLVESAHPDGVDLHLAIHEGGNPVSGPPLLQETVNFTNDFEQLFMWDVSTAGLVFDVGDVFTFAFGAGEPGVVLSGNDPPGYDGGELYRNGAPLPEDDVNDLAFITYVIPGGESGSDYALTQLTFSQRSGSSLPQTFDPVEISFNACAPEVVSCAPADGVTRTVSASEVGSELVLGSPADGAFESIVASLTDGVTGSLSYHVQRERSGSGIGGNETSLLKSLGTLKLPNGVDLSGFDIVRIDVVVDKWEITEEDDGGGGTHFRTEFVARIIVIARFVGTPPCLLVGTSRDETLIGTDSNDVICGRGGHDIIFGRAGDDILRGGSGDDRIFGGLGEDVIKGNAGFDRLVGGAHADDIVGGPDDDVLRGKSGDDTLEGNVGDDRLFGAKGDDSLNGGQGVDECNGGIGNNTIVACE